MPMKIVNTGSKRQRVQRMHIARAGSGAQVAQIVGVVFGFAGIGRGKVGKLVMLGGRERALLLLALQLGIARGKLGIASVEAVVDGLGRGHGGLSWGWG